MLEAARAAMRFVAGRTFESYLADDFFQAAVERKVEIIGEAARKVSKKFQDAHPEIAWRPIMAQRHILAHEYGEIKHDRIWRVVSHHVPELIQLLEPLTPPLPS